MKEYFILQYRMTNRKLSEVGVNPLFGYLLGIIGFVLLVEFAFYKTEYARYLVLVSSFSFLSNLSDRNRNEFLMSTFGESISRQIRIIENLIICIPFGVLLCFHTAFLESIILYVAAIIMAVVSFKRSINFTIPTPFYKDPFEFIVGFRKTFYVFPLAYMLTVIAISVDNMNLGIFAMFLVFLFSISYYANPENEYFVWVHSDTPSAFLLKKIRTATKHAFLLSIPIIISLVAFYPKESYLIVLFFLVGLLFLWTLILAKYSVYPREMNLPEGILITVSIFFPPFLLVLIPYLYRKSITSLNLILV